MSDLDQYLRDPSWFPEAIDPGRDVIRLARVTRDGLANEPFLDSRMAGIVTDRADVSLTNSLKQFQSTSTPSFIFHSAFCCSTLMARALDAPGATLSLKEPDILMQLANILRVDDRAKREPEYANGLVRLVFGLLARPFSDGEKILVKPTNSANNLAPYAMRAGAEVLFLYGDLRSFIVSVIKKGEPCRSFVRQQYNIFALDPEGLSNIPQRQAVGFTDLQAAAVVWRHQMELFQRELLRLGQTQAASLDFRQLLGHPGKTLVTAAQHLDLPQTAATLRAVADGPVFSKNSKFGEEEYDAGQRRRDEEAIVGAHRDTLDLIEKWASAVSLGENLQMPLPKALLA